MPPTTCIKLTKKWDLEEKGNESNQGILKRISRKSKKEKLILQTYKIVVIRLMRVGRFKQIHQCLPLHSLQFPTNSWQSRLISLEVSIKAGI